MPDDLTLSSGDDLVLSGSDLRLAEEAPAAPPDLRSSDVEAEALAEVNAVLSGFREGAQREDQRFADATDSEYWVALCFQTREQKEEFLRKLGLLELGDKYLDGMAVARKLKVKLESRVPPLPELRLDRRLLDLVG